MAVISLQIEGMHCGGCAGRVDKALRAVPGVTDAAVNLTTGMASVRGQAQEQALVAAVENVGYKARVLGTMSAQTLREVGQRGAAEEEAQHRRLMFGLLFGVPAIATEMMLHHQAFFAIHFYADFHEGYNILTAALATLAIAASGWLFFVRGLRSAIRLAPNMDTLVALGAGTAYVTSLISLIHWLETTTRDHLAPTMPSVSEFHAAVAIVVLVTLGKYLEARAKKRAASAVAGLAAQAAASATRIGDGGVLETVPAEQIRVGDRLQVLAHQQLPVDGELVEGAGSVDMSIITGESVPVEVAVASGGGRRKAAAARLSLPVVGAPAASPAAEATILPGGATLADGRIVIRATSTAGTSTVAKILDLVNRAQASKTQIQGVADRVAGIFVPVILLLAAVDFGLWMLVGKGWAPALVSAIATIIIACPCAMGLATPTAITVAMGRAARLGILFTKASALEAGRRIGTVVFDKTGTLTTGKLQFTRAIAAEGIAESELLRLAASAEQFSEHPLAKALVARAREQGFKLAEPAKFHSAPGGGVEAEFAGAADGLSLAAGSETFIRSLGVVVEAATVQGLQAQGMTVILLADVRRKKHLGTLGFQDALRPDAAEVLASLKARGIRIGVISGDSHAAVEAALKGLPLDFIRAQVRPEEKAAAIAELRTAAGRDARQPGIAFVGDGINDGPALAAADLGIAMASGTDVAKAAGDVLLMNNHLSAVPAVLQLSHRTLRIIQQNLFWAFGYNVAAIPLAIMGILPPAAAAAAMMLSSLSVVGNALRLYRVKV